MKLIIAGSTGFVGTELVRQAIANPQFTSVIALARRETSAPEDADPKQRGKLQNVILKDFGHYSEDIKKELAGADACIWTVAVLPGKAITMPWEDFRKICHDYTLLGLQTMVEARGESKAPFRFMYMSGAAAQRDQSKKPRIMPQYLLLRGEIESRVLEYAAQHKGEVEVCVAKPGIILKPGYISQRIVAAALNLTGIVGNLSIKEVAAAMLQQVINGFEKEPLENEDLKRIGTAALKLT